jgi:hypothetical protein
VVLAVRDDEANHRDINHGYATQLADGTERLDATAQTPSLEPSIGK